MSAAVILNVPFRADCPSLTGRFGTPSPSAGAPPSSSVTYGPLDRESVAAAKPIELCELADRDRPSASMSE
jgi:hypothetical protein